MTLVVKHLLKTPMKIQLSESIAREFQGIYWTNCPTRYRVIYGARNTGKSWTFLGTEIVDKIVRDPTRNVCVFRAVASDIKSTAFSEIKKALYRTGFFLYFQIKEHDVEIIYKPTGQKIMFFGCDRGTAVNGVVVPIGEITDFYFEEAYELKDYELFKQIDGSIRGGYKTQLKNGIKVPKQVTFLLNPWHAEGCWIYDVFVRNYLPDTPQTQDFLEKMGYRQRILPELVLEKGIGLALHQSTYKVNHWRDKETYDLVAKTIRAKIPRTYQVEFLGMWGVSGDVLYTEYSDKLIIEEDLAKDLDYRIVYVGIDTAFSNGEGKELRGSQLDLARIKHAYSIQLAGITRTQKGNIEQGTLVALDEYYYTQEIYGRRKTQPELIRDTLDTILSWTQKYSSNSSILKGRIVVYVDSGDQGTIDALNLAIRERNLSNLTNSSIVILSSTKKRISTRVRFINQLMGLGRVRICSNCKHLAREFSISKEGKGKPREDVNDHAINAFEYGTTPMWVLTKDWANFKEYRS